MGYDAIKLELIEWVTHLEDDETLHYLKIVKDSNESSTDWLDDLTNEQKEGIARGLNDIQAGRVHTHEDVKRMYGL